MEINYNHHGPLNLSYVFVVTFILFSFTLKFNIYMLFVIMLFLFLSSILFHFLAIFICSSQSFFHSFLFSCRFNFFPSAVLHSILPSTQISNKRFTFKLIRPTAFLIANIISKSADIFNKKATLLTI